MKIKRVIHLGWQEVEDANSKIKGASLTHFIGKYQYIATDGKKELSIVKFLKDGAVYKSDFYEVARLNYGKDKRVKVLDRFHTLKQAKEFCRECLDGR